MQEIFIYWDAFVWKFHKNTACARTMNVFKLHLVRFESTRHIFFCRFIIYQMQNAKYFMKYVENSR